MDGQWLFGWLFESTAVSRAALSTGGGGGGDAQASREDGWMEMEGLDDGGESGLMRGVW